MATIKINHLSKASQIPENDLLFVQDCDCTVWRLTDSSFKYAYKKPDSMFEGRVKNLKSLIKNIYQS